MYYIFFHNIINTVFTGTFNLRQVFIVYMLYLHSRLKSSSLLLQIVSHLAPSVDGDRMGRILMACSFVVESLNHDPKNIERSIYQTGYKVLSPHIVNITFVNEMIQPDLLLLTVEIKEVVMSEANKLYQQKHPWDDETIGFYEIDLTVN